MATNLLRPPQIIELENERKYLDEQLNGPWKHLVQEPGKVRQRLNDLTKQLDEGRPHPITDPLERDKLAKVERELREELVGGMLTQEEMRKNPPNAAERLRAWERAMKSKILAWKDARLRLAADTSPIEAQNRDEANLEQFRPEGAIGRLRLDAQIPGKLAMSPQAKEHWPLGEPTVDTAMGQAVKHDKWAKARAAKLAKRATASEPQ